MIVFCVCAYAPKNVEHLHTEFRTDGTSVPLTYNIGNVPAIYDAYLE